MSRVAKQMLLSWLIASVLMVAAVLATLGAPLGSRGTSEVAGRIVMLAGIAALLSGWIARKRAPPWGTWHYAGVYVAMLIGVVAATTIGRASAVEADAKASIEVQFEDGWEASILQGVSSDPRDRDIGMRLRAEWSGKEGKALMEFSCMWKNYDPDLAFELGKATEILGRQVQALDLVFKSDAAQALRSGERDWLLVKSRIAEADGTVVASQRLAVANGEHCFLGAQLAGAPKAFAMKVPAFERTLATLREVPP